MHREEEVSIVMGEEERVMIGQILLTPIEIEMEDQMMLI